MNLVTKALLFSTQAHSDRLCPGTRIPYMAHVLDTFRTLSETTYNEETLVALLLHDTLQYDHISLNDIEETFGEAIAAILSPFQSIDKLDRLDQWPNKDIGVIEEITLHFIQEEATKEQLLLLASMMIHNIESTYHSYLSKAWPVFPQDQPIDEDDVFDSSGYTVQLSKEKMESISYYNALADAFASRQDESIGLQSLVQHLRGTAFSFLQY